MTSTQTQPAERTLDHHDDTSGRSRNLALNTQPSSKSQDLAIFGLIGLGIIGLLWIRRHTSEL